MNNKPMAKAEFFTHCVMVLGPPDDNTISAYWRLADSVYGFNQWHHTWHSWCEWYEEQARDQR